MSTAADVTASLPKSQSFTEPTDRYVLNNIVLYYIIRLVGNRCYYILYCKPFCRTRTSATEHMIIIMSPNNMCYLGSLKPACTLLYLPIIRLRCVLTRTRARTRRPCTDAYHLSNARAIVFSPL